MGKPCNRCLVERIRREAKKAGERVTCRNSDRSLGLGGVDVYVHPADVKLPKAGRMPDAEHDKYFRAWVHTIPPACAC